jgi:hypothetical protein
MRLRQTIAELSAENARLKDELVRVSGPSPF